MQLVSTLAVLASVLVFAYQARELARQTRVANQVAGTVAHRDTMAYWGRWNSVFIEYPELYAHYYDETQAEPTAVDRVRLKIIAEQQSGVMEQALLTARQLAVYDYSWIVGDWDDYVALELASSSWLRAFIRESPEVPALLEHLARYESTHEPEV